MTSPDIVEVRNGYGQVIRTYVASTLDAEQLQDEQLYELSVLVRNTQAEVD